MYLINTHNGIASKNVPAIDINKYPAIKEHLDRYWTKIKNRNDQGVTPYNLRSCVYMDEFYKQKIIYPDIMRMPKNQSLLNTYPYFYFDKAGFYAEATNFILSGDNLELIFTFLVSDIGFYLFSRFYSGPQFDETGFRYKKEYLNNLYIPKITQQDNASLMRCFYNKIFDSEKIDKIGEDIFVRIARLDNNEVQFIKNYKKSLLKTQSDP